MEGCAMRVSPILFLITVLTALLAIIAAGAGLFWHDPGPSIPFQTAHGETIELHGQGLYRADWAFKVPIQRGTDAVMLFVGVPALLLSLFLARRGAVRSYLLMTGLLAVFVYNAVSTAFGVAFNPLYPVYLAYFSASFFAFVLAFRGMDLDQLAAQITPNLPRLGPAIFLFSSALSTSIWLIEIIPALLEGRAPASVASYTTDIIALLDLGIIAPSCLLAGVFLLRRKPLGVPLTAIFLVFMTMVGIIVLGQRIMQAVDGEQVTAAQNAVYVVPFVALSLVAIGLTGVFLREIRENVSGAAQAGR
jgi:hypothetical protein